MDKAGAHVTNEPYSNLIVENQQGVHLQHFFSLHLGSVLLSSVEFVEAPLSLWVQDMSKFNQFLSN